MKSDNVGFFSLKLVIGRYMINFRLEHWDVNNENLHGDFYEQRTGNPNITMKMFRDIHSVDQNVKLFLNDFSIVQAENSNRATVS